MENFILVGVFGLAALAHSWSSPRKQAAEIADLVGDWSGTSLCEVKPSPCNDEQVVYHLSNPRADKITVQADKIVDGKSINMGSGDWTYDKSAGMLKWEMPRGMWKLVVEDDNMDGTLTGLDKVVFRKIHLRKSR